MAGNVTVVVGAQWGDEGKGRVVDYLAAGSDMVIRFQGGDNAGHTVVNEHGRFALHLIPCGIFYPQVRCLLGAGTVVNLNTVAEEVATLRAAGVEAQNLWIDHRAHLIWPYHRLLDGAEEDRRIYEKELARLEMSLQRMDPKALLRVALLHYPPTSPALERTEVCEMLEKYGVHVAVFGHVHRSGEGEFTNPFGNVGGVALHLASADYIDFRPVLLAQME